MPLIILIVAIAIALLMAGIFTYFFGVKPMHAEKLSREIFSLYQRKQFSEAIETAKKVLKVMEQTHGYPAAGAALNALAFLYLEAGSEKEAEPLLQKALSYYDERAAGKSYPDVTVLLNQLGIIAGIFGQTSRAEHCFKQSLEIRKKNLGADHALTVIALDNLANLCFLDSRYEEAKALFREAMAAKEKIFGKESTIVADSLNDLARLAAESGNLEGAEALLNHAIEIDKKASGGAAASYARDLLLLAKVYTKQGRENEVQTLKNRAEKILEEEIKKLSPGFINTLYDTAGLMVREGMASLKASFSRKAGRDQQAIYKDCWQRQRFRAYPGKTLKLLKEIKLWPEELHLPDSLAELCSAFYLYGRYAELQEKSEPNSFDFEVNFGIIVAVLQSLIEKEIAKSIHALYEESRRKTMDAKELDSSWALGEISRLCKEIGKTAQARKFEDHAKRIQKEP